MSGAYTRSGIIPGGHPHEQVARREAAIQHCGYDDMGTHDMAHSCPGFRAGGSVTLSPIDPFVWVTVASERRPKLPHTTEWFDGMTAPAMPGWYERHFVDSSLIGDASMKWWDGGHWYFAPNGLRHWRQVGDYPAWRGLAIQDAQAKQGEA